MIQIKDISTTYGSRKVLDHISYDFDPSRTHVLLGSSGCGKSTLLRVILGVLCPCEGEVRISGDPMTPETRLGLTRKIGYVVQDGGLFPHLTARENISLVAKTLGWSKSKIRERILDLLTLTGLEDSLLEQFPKQLSGGQRQRVGLARALMLDPALLLLDEPLGALDPIVRAELQQQLKSLFARMKKTVILVTHDLAEAAFLGDHILLMSEGKIVQSGTYSELLNHPNSEFVSHFIHAQAAVNEFLRGANL